MPIRTDDDRYLKLHELAYYTSLSVRTLQRFIKEKVHPLPVHRFGERTILVKRSEFDQWLKEREEGSGSRTVTVDEHTSRAQRAALEIKGYAVTEPRSSEKH